MSGGCCSNSAEFITLPLTNLLVSTYDSAGHLLVRRFTGNGAGLRLAQAWTGAGQPQSVQRYPTWYEGPAATSRTDWTYDDAGRLTRLLTSNAAGATLEDYAYAYDAAGWVTTQTINGTGTGYGYDGSGQLLQAGATAYTYDAAGNRTTSGYQTGPNNRLLSDGAWSYAYDDEGNRVGKTKVGGPVAESWAYAYDQANQLTLATHTVAGTVVLTIAYGYDAFGQRVQEERWTQATGTQVNRFGYDGGNVWADLDGGNALVTRYVRPDGVDALAARVSAAGTVAWYVQDRLGSVRALTDSAGVVQDRITYDAYGQVASETNPTFGDRYKYTAREYDAGSGLQYNRARWYDAATGRWLSEDPLGFDAGDSNLARYVGNGPTNRTDPSGQAERPSLAALLSGPDCRACHPRKSGAQQVPREYQDLFAAPRRAESYPKTAAGQLQAALRERDRVTGDVDPATIAAVGDTAAIRDSLVVNGKLADRGRLADGLAPLADSRLDRLGMAGRGTARAALALGVLDSGSQERMRTRILADALELIATERVLRDRAGIPTLGQAYTLRGTQLVPAAQEELRHAERYLRDQEAAANTVQLAVLAGGLVVAVFFPPAIGYTVAQTAGLVGSSVAIGGALNAAGQVDDVRQGKREGFSGFELFAGAVGAAPLGSLAAAVPVFVPLGQVGRNGLILGGGALAGTNAALEFREGRLVSAGVNASLALAALTNVEGANGGRLLRTGGRRGSIGVLTSAEESATSTGIPKPGTPEWIKPWPEEWVRPKGNRLPSDKYGRWSGQKGHSYFIPNDPAAHGLKPGEVVPYRQGKPDFAKWAKDGKTYTAKERLTGFDDVDRPIFERTLRDEFNSSVRDGRTNWTREQVADWLRNAEVTPHHAGGDGFQLIPWKLHGNRSAKPPIPGLSHSGGAVDLRNVGQ